MTERRPHNGPAHAERTALDPDDLLALCKASADQLRLAILRVLRRDSYGVLELCRIFDHRQSGMSHHLKILAGAGLVASRREGNSIFYRRTVSAAHPELDPLQRNLFAAVDLMPLPAATLRGIRAVQAEREKLSREFFARHADAFREQQELIAEHNVYGAATTELLDENLPGREAALEVGTGEGALLPDLARRFRRVYALDTSAEMLARARETAARARLANIRFIHGDTGHPDRPDGVDAVVACMVLHHVPSPAALLEDMAAMLRPGGLLCVTDLCLHDQAWAQQACGDLWLGFEPDDLSNWARGCGLLEGDSTYIAQRNGFRVQVRQFSRPAA